jgi:cytochrome P450
VDLRIEGYAMQSLAELDLPHLQLEAAAFAADPFPHFAAARAQHPWLARSVFGLVVTEYEAMKDLLAMDGALRTANDGFVAIMGGQGTRWGRFAEENIFNQQGDAHRRLRLALTPIFTPRHANEIRPLIREVIEDLLDAWAPKGSFNFEEFASCFPISVICRMIGGPVEAIPRLKSSLETWGAAFHMDRAIVPELEVAHGLIEDYVQDLVAARRARGRSEGEEDLLDMLIRAGADGLLSEREIVDLIMFLYTAGFDTSKNVLTLIMRQLIDRPDVYARCADDLEYCRKVVEETLRYSGVSTSSRVTTEAIEYRGVALPKDTMVFVPVSVAGRDAGAFADADRFDPDRPDDTDHRHIGFGRGAHVCLGQYLARAQLQEGLHAVARRIRNPRLAGEIAWRPFPGIWGLKGLPITFTPA